MSYALSALSIAAVAGRYAPVAAATDGTLAYCYVSAQSETEYVVFVATSTDGGASWTHTAVPGSLMAYTSTNVRLYAYGAGFLLSGDVGNTTTGPAGLLRSADGVTWDALSPPSPDAWSVDSLSADGSNVVVVTTVVDEQTAASYYALAVSADAGTSWTMYSLESVDVATTGLTTAVGNGVAIVPQSSGGYALVSLADGAITSVSGVLADSPLPVVAAFDGTQFGICARDADMLPRFYTSSDGVTLVAESAAEGATLFGAGSGFFVFDDGSSTYVLDGGVLSDLVQYVQFPEGRVTRAYGSTFFTLRDTGSGDGSGAFEAFVVQGGLSGEVATSARYALTTAVSVAHRVESAITTAAVQTISSVRMRLISARAVVTSASATARGAESAVSSRQRQTTSVLQSLASVTAQTVRAVRTSTAARAVRTALSRTSRTVTTTARLVLGYLVGDSQQPLPGSGLALTMSSAVQSSGRTVRRVNPATLYDNYPFNSFAVLDGVAYGCGPAGIYALDGGDEDFTTRVHLGRTDLGSRLRKAVDVVHVARTAGTASVRISADAGAAYTYAVNPVREPGRMERAVPGRGLLGATHTIELRGDADLGVESVDIVVGVGARR